ncbi:hypothetical protein M422DRAFT_243622 [Sphaerobolus stellatus SS14]|nr:hypothetical protein M422DRAFT_243622 [Sphaerobolus stellatus SS14]
MGNETILEIEFPLLNSEEDASNFVKMLPAVKQVDRGMDPASVQLPPLPSVTVISLADCYFGKRMVGKSRGESRLLDWELTEAGDSGIIQLSDGIRTGRPFIVEMADLTEITNSAAEKCYINILPHELISAIFEYTAAGSVGVEYTWGRSTRELYNPWVALDLSHVSSHWRSVAKANPLLWRDINPIHTEFASFCSELALVDLEVAFHLLKRGEYLSDPIIEAASFFIHENAPRISKLVVSGCHPFLGIFLMTPFPELTTSIFDLNSQMRVSIPFLDNLPTLTLFGGYAPKLQYVKWTCIRLPSLANIPWSNLTTLDVNLDRYFPNDMVLNQWSSFMALLSRNPNLETLSIAIPRSKSNFNSGSIHLLSLHEVSISVANIQDLKTFLQVIFAPKILGIHIVITEATSFSDLFSALRSQASLLSLLDETEGCAITPLSDLDIYCWNKDNETIFEIQFTLLDIEEDMSDFAKMLPAVKQLDLKCIPPQFKLPPLPSVTVLSLSDCNSGKVWKADVNTFPLLSTVIILPRPPSGWWEGFVEALDHLIGNSPKLEKLVSSSYCLSKVQQGILEELCGRYGVLWQYHGLNA